MLTVTVDDSAFRAYLQNLQKALGNLEPVMDAIGVRLESNVRNRFATRTDPNGQAWVPWRPATVESYPYPASPAAAKDGPGNARLLDRYGTMLGSLSYDANAASVRVGFGQSYATYHEFGTEHMERRGMLMADPDQGTLGKGDEAAVLDVLDVWLTNLTA
jgi:phage virion morphogenesis protein